MIQETREISVVVLGCLPSSQIILPKQWCEGDTGSPYQEETNEGIREDLLEAGLLPFPGASSPPPSCHVGKDNLFLRSTLRACRSGSWQGRRGREQLPMGAPAHPGRPAASWCCSHQGRPLTLDPQYALHGHPFHINLGVARELLQETKQDPQEVLRGT